MLKRYQDMEIAYTKLFSEIKDFDHYAIFSDSNLPGMYVHNFLMFKETIERNQVIDTINKQILKRKEEGCDFFRAEFNFPINLDFISDLIHKPSIGYFDVMAIKTLNYKSLPDRLACEIKRASDDRTYEDGRTVDIFANTEVMGEAFSKKRIERKLQVYQSKPIEFYVCYTQEKAIGNCELFVHDQMAKIEDFDIIYTHQKKGFGTYFIKNLLRSSNERGVIEAYLITDSDDTAKEMYLKCGFEKIGIKTELIFDF